MNDIRSQLPECPLAYEVPLIPANHTALGIPIMRSAIDYQEKMLPWTLASLINNTDLIMTGVHLYIPCHAGTEDRIRSAVSNFDFSPDRDPVLYWKEDSPFIDGYATVRLFNMNYWAFRDASNTHKLEIGDTLKHGNLEAKPYPDISEMPPEPQLYDMTHCTPAQFRHAIKHLLGAQLAMKI